MKIARMEFSILSHEEETPYLSWVEDFTSVMNSYCKITTSVRVMPLYLIIINTKVAGEDRSATNSTENDSTRLYKNGDISVVITGS